MYDWELQNYLQEHNYVISHQEYLHICNTSPQIKHIECNHIDNYFEVWTDCNYFKFQVYLNI